MKKLSLFIFAVLVNSNALAGNLEKVFGEGILETKWGMSFDDVSKVYPNHEKTEFSGQVGLVIENSRELMKIPRDDEKIQFGFGTNDKLSSVSIFYDNDYYGDLLAKLRENFGLPSDPIDKAGITTIEWPIDNDIKMTLMFMQAGWSIDVILTIAHLEQDANSKDDLGF